MLDRELAELYGVETGQLKRQVNRNINRFPEDFMFELTKEEVEVLRSQNATSKMEGRGGIRYLPYAFTEHGVLMLSNVLNSEKAVKVSIQVIRAFSKLKQMLSTHEDLKKKIEEMENRYDHQFRIIFDAIKQLIEEDLKPKRDIGFERNKK
jgi:phage regulator Rha-like protein